MKKLVVIILPMIFILFLIGCNKDDALLQKQQSQIKELKDKVAVLEDTINKQQNFIDSDKEFSYLHSFTNEELKTYNLFAKDKDATHLSGLSPDQVLLIFLHSVVIDDLEAIYSLTYDDGTLPDLVAFRDNYHKEGLYKKEMNATFKYRYYTSIKVKEDNKTDNETFVEITVSFGIYTSSTIYGLKKDNGVWKIDILPLMEQRNS